MLSAKSVCEALNQPSWDEPKNFWHSVWKLHVHLGIKTFLWLTRKNALMTNSYRFKRHIASNPSCDLCPGREEDWVHVLRSCPIACMVCCELNPSSRFDEFLTKNLDDWLGDNIKNPTCCSDGTAWNVRCSVAYWLIWRWRNEGIFTSKLPCRRSA